MIMGDFNLHINTDSNAVLDFNSSLGALGLQLHVDFQTHIYGQSLDLVITEWRRSSCEPGPFLSDHSAVKVVTKVKKENNVSKYISFRNFKNMQDQEDT